MRELTLKEQGDRLNYKPSPAPHRMTLIVPFSEKDQAKALGAKWDATVKKWYISAEMDMGKFRRWLPKN